MSMATRDDDLRIKGHKCEVCGQRVRGAGGGARIGTGKLQKPLRKYQYTTVKRVVCYRCNRSGWTFTKCGELVNLEWHSSTSECIDESNAAKDVKYLHPPR